MASGKRARRVDNVIELKRTPVNYGFQEIKPLIKLYLV
jgi:hypothetical protein